MNKWVNPPPIEPQNEVSFPEQTGLDKPFSFYLGQVGKKKVVNNDVSGRIAEKSVSLSGRIGMQGDK